MSTNFPIKKFIVNATGAILAIGALAAMPRCAPPYKSIAFTASSVWNRLQTELTISETVTLYGKDARSRLLPHFKRARVKYPPEKVLMLGLKQEKVLIIFAREEGGPLKQVVGYPIVGTSGNAGPKLKEGDLQVPEGFYKISGLYPNSIAHLGLRVNYPNNQDRLRAKADKRTKLGGDILVHGSFWSTGCLAMGNTAIEEIYILAHDVGCKNIDLVLSPCDLTTTKPDIDFKKQPAWLPTLYKDLRAALKSYPVSIDPSWRANAEGKPE